MTTPMTRCPTHGEMPWEGHIICTKCGATYTDHDGDRRNKAGERCIKCRARLLPLPNVTARGRGMYTFTMRPTCAGCYRDNPGGTLQDEHGRDSPICKGVNCPFHGAQMLREEKRAKQMIRATWGAARCQWCCSKPSKRDLDRIVDDAFAHRGVQQPAGWLCEVCAPDLALTMSGLCWHVVDVVGASPSETSP